ncbi:MAG: 2Fe-2S iron-sulfur cluster binding domain-containing protein, partial [Proteus hauseri]|nr:2Fe-2S iron-sulfur cluster binding domain-containing protein [Proteus hauseri]
MHKVTFKFENSEDIIVFAAFGESLLEVARKTNVAIDAPCSGNASCGKCRVKLVGGELESKKTRHITDEDYAEGWRLACVSTINADVEVLVPDIASAYRSRMKVADLSSPEELKIFSDAKEQILEAGIELKNTLEILNVSMDEPTLDDTMPDNERFTRAITAITGIEKIRVPYSVLKKLPDVLRESNFRVKIIVRKIETNIFVYDVFPENEDVIVGGIAIDIGTTTVSAILINMLDGSILAKGSSGNGQIRYGADVINRIIESAKPGGKERLQKAVIEETINPLIQTMCRQAKLDPMSIYRMCIAGNTTMNHLL